jgi:hypothetical protein
MVPAVTPQLVANDGARALRLAINDPERFACEPKVDGVRGLVVAARRRFRARAAPAGGHPNLWDGTVLDGGLIAGCLAGTMAAMRGGKA